MNLRVGPAHLIELRNLIVFDVPVEVWRGVGRKKPKRKAVAPKGAAA